MKRLAWHGILNDITGYGVPTYELTQVLENMGIEIILRPDFSKGVNLSLPLHRQQYERGYPLKDIPVSINFNVLPDATWGFGVKKIVYTSLEADNMPTEWLRVVEQRADALFCPSEYNKKVWTGRGLTKPIYVIPHGVSDIFRPEGNKLIIPYENYFTFLAVFRWRPNKFDDLLLEAYCEEFKRDEPVHLFIKTFEDIDPYKRVEQIAGKCSPHITINTESFTRQKLAMLYRACHCIVAIGMEGFDLPLLEAMACGLPAIALNYGGHTDFINDGEVIIINDYPAIYPKDSMVYFYRGFGYRHPDKASLRKAMRYAFENQNTLLKEANTQAKVIAEKYNWENIAKKIIDIIDELKWW